MTAGAAMSPADRRRTRTPCSWCGDDELVRVVVDQRHGAGLRREFAVRLVDDQDAAGHGIQQASQVVERNALPGRVVGARDEHHVGAASLDGVDRGLDVGPKSSARAAVIHSVWVPSGRDRGASSTTARSRRRAGPASKACSSCCRISLEPFAAHRFSVANATPVAAAVR